MQIIVDNKLAALKKGTSFEYVSENRMFGGADGYSLTITFPLKDCPRNQAIFGHINRADVSTKDVIFDAEIIAGAFHRHGCIVINDISESEVKTQFLDGRSEQNFDSTFDKIFINELDLGKPSSTSKSSFTPSSAWQPNHSSPESVVLPWVNSSGYLQNKVVYDKASQSFKWHSDTTGLSWMPYLLYITRRICAAVGYECDLSQWESREEYKYLLICNTLPYAWYTSDYARALPHWSVEEYFAKLELFLGAEFDIDHRARRISFAFTNDLLAVTPNVRLDNVTEVHNTEVKVEDPRCEYADAKNLAYKESSHQMQKFYSCPWFVRHMTASGSLVVTYDTMSKLLSDNKWLSTGNGSTRRGSNYGNILYAADVDAYFIIRAVSRKNVGYKIDGKTIDWLYQYVLQPVNLLGPRIVDDSEDAPGDEIEFVPACIDYTDDDNGFAVFLSFSGYDESDDTAGGTRVNGPEPFSKEWYEEKNARFYQTQSMQTLEAGDAEKKAEYYDRVYVAWWDGATGAGSNLPPHPHAEDIAVNPDWSNYQNLHFSLRLNDRHSARSRIRHDIDPTQKTTFRWLAPAANASIPNVRSLFLIRGKRYICEKITATFTESGMSQLLKGVFYPVKED